MPSYQWSYLLKDSSLRSSFRECTRFQVANHPLKPITYISEQQNLSWSEASDPLSAAMDGGDPLSTFVQESLLIDDEDTFQEVVPVESCDKSSRAWLARKNSILNKYTTVEKLSIISSFLPGGEKVLQKQSSNVSEQVKHRLEQLDQFEEGSVRRTMGLTQQEYAAKIVVLNNELVQAWKTEQRVKALKIAIQCSKLLTDTSVMQFYPSKFVLITDILDTFGNLVFERLSGKSFENKSGSITLDEVNPDTVPETAKETCQNWLYKMASIRELLPRLYVEMSLLRCYIFLSRNEFDSAIARLTRMIRGVGNPLVAAYARCYLCRVALNVITKNRNYFNGNLQEFLLTYNQIFDPILQHEYESQSLNKDMYLSLYVPALDWMLYGTITYGTYTETLLEELIDQCSNIQNKELLLYCVMSSFDSANIAKRAEKILDIIDNSESIAMKHEMLVQLGEHACSSKQLQQATSELLVERCWRLTTNLNTLPHFLRVCEPWMQFAATHLSSKHLNILVRGMIKYMSKCDERVDEYPSLLQAVLRRMLTTIEDVDELLLMDGFMPILDLVERSQGQVDMAKMILNIFFEKQISPVIGDQVVISNLMRLCRTLHDSINALTVDDEKKLISELICMYVQRVSYHEEWEQQLSFYVECRGAFINLDAVLVALVFAVNKLATQCAGAGSWLVRACAAYCFITAPSLQCPLLKAQLYLLSGQVALLNNGLGQAEACFKISISLIPEIPAKRLEDGQMKPTQVKVHALVSNFLSTLLVMPDNVEANCQLYLLNGLLKAVHKLDWERTDSMFYSILLLVLDLLNNLAQENYSYHIESVISNDLLYGSDKEFINEIENLATTVTEELLVILKQLGDSRQLKKQHYLALELFWRVVRRGNMKAGPMATLAANLWLLAQKNQDSDLKLSKSLLTGLQKENDAIINKLLKI